LLETDPLPLIVMSPKSLLRHPRAASSLNDLAEGHWQPVIVDTVAKKETKQVNRLVLCSGKVYADLVSSESRETNHAVAIARVEQLYPFPEDEISSLINKYPALKEVVWLQEEPENMGAWTFVQPRLNNILDDRLPLRYIGRPANSSPAEGSMARHGAVQRQLVEAGLAPIK
jgi:2-oxoglutarate dehydrogenase E1 component